MRGTQKPESVAVTWNFGNEAEQYTQTETGPYKDTGRITNDCLHLNIFLIVQVSKRNEKTVLQRTTFLCPRASGTKFRSKVTDR